LKIAGTELGQGIDSLYVEASCYYALPYVRDQYVVDFPDDERIGDGTQTSTALTYFNNRKVTIFGGSNEIQKNIIAKHVLGV
jgi:alkylation response protein AidB-like acyl-CoA dehydrogenase